MKSALITGITGQDGWYLSKLLSSKSYQIFGMVTDLNNKTHDDFSSEFPDIKLVKGDLTDTSSIKALVNEIMPDEIYNFGGFSSVGLSYKNPETVANVNGIGLVRLLEACKNIYAEKQIRIYQASSSEMFGGTESILQNENSPFQPVSPYGVSKVFAHLTAKNYREIFNIHVSSGITFNHESERRDLEYVTRKITNSAAKIKLGLLDKIVLGDLSTSRDWGYAGDYVEAMWQMLQMENPDDYVIATGKLHSLRELLKITFTMIGMKGEEDNFITTNPSYIRPAEIKNIAGDISKAKQLLNWQPKTTFEDIISRMLLFDLKLEAKKANMPIPKMISL
jgi:GDPmannose 4,6-dehydratase